MAMMHSTITALSFDVVMSLTKKRSILSSVNGNCRNCMRLE